MRMVEKALTFDDVLLLPAHSVVLPRNVNLTTRLTRGISLNIPLVSAAMDTVTEARLAIALAQEGGIGIIHKNMSVEAQAAHVARVKRFESGVVKDPITIPPDMTVREVLNLIRKYKISGLPVVEGAKVVGIVTNRDLRFETNLDQPIKNIMTLKNRLVTVNEGATREEAMALLHKYRLERVLVVNSDFELRGLITVKDIIKTSEHPSACKDDLGRLRVGAAVGVGEGSQERTEALAEAGVDVIVVDTAHGHSQSVLDAVNWVKKRFPKIQVIGGNIATAAAAKALADQGGGWGKSRDRAWLHLHDAYSCRCRGSPDHCDQKCVRGAGKYGRAFDCRWRHSVFRRHCEGDRRRSQFRNVRRALRRNGRIAGRNRAFPRPFL